MSKLPVVSGVQCIKALEKVSTDHNPTSTNRSGLRSTARLILSFANSTN